MEALGFIGLGQMGGPMAAHLAGASIDLTVHDKADPPTPGGGGQGGVGRRGGGGR